MKRFQRSVLFVLVQVLLFVGCVQRRSPIEAQGSNLGELVAVSDVAQWKHTITTGSNGPEYASITNADKLQIRKELSDIKFLGVVKFETDAPLIREQKNRLDLYGEPNSTYPLVYRLSPKYLKVYKRVSAAQISHYELPYAEQEASGYLVPVGGFPVTYYSVEFAKNEDNRDSNVQTKFPVSPNNFRLASHVDINRAGFEPFRRVEKRDVLPADYFTKGEWYYSKSLVSAKPGEETGIGYFESGVSTGFELANKIRFSQVKGFLRGTNVAVSKQKLAYSSGKDQQDDVLNIPVDWQDYRAKQDWQGADLVNSTLLEEEAYGLRQHSERKYGQFKFVLSPNFEFGAMARRRDTGAVSEGSTDDLMATVGAFQRLDSLMVDNDSFSFTILKVLTGEKIRYSFLRVKPSDYVPRSYRESDNNLFGAFRTHIPYEYTSRDARRGDLEANEVINRFNSKKDIVFRFTRETPRFGDIKDRSDRLHVDYRQVGRYCVKYWNRVFDLAQTGIKVVLKESEDGSEDGEVGDINTNLINILDTLSEGGLAGVGPSMADPSTGETIAGAANIYVGSYRRVLFTELRNYIGIRSGLIRDYAFPKEIQDKRRLMDYVQSEVEHFCPAVVDYADSLKGKAPLTTSENEAKVIEHCVEKMLPKVLTATTCHEMGHVLSLRHNFQCSADKANAFSSFEDMERVYPRKDFPEIYRDWYPTKEFLPSSSCIMDYAADDRPSLVMPGRYDIAAIAYIYSDKVEKKDTRANSPNGVGELVSIDPKIPLKDQANFVNSEPYQFCTDEDVMSSRKGNPFCDKFDYGSDPSSLMDYYFESYRDNVVINGRRWDRFAANYHPGLSVHYLQQMSAIYALWRVHLYDFVGRDNSLLYQYQDEVAANGLKASLDSSFAHKEFLGINKKYLSYMMNIASIPDLYCVAINKSANPILLDQKSDLKLFRFDQLQDAIVSSGFGEKVEGCSDPVVNRYLAAKQGGNWEVKGEVGYPVDNVRFSKAKEDQDKSFDVVGLRGDRVAALEHLTFGVPSSISFELGRRNYIPHPLDESVIFNSTENFVRQRLFSGLDLSGPLAELLKSNGLQLAAGQEIKPFAKFQSDWRIYKDAFMKLPLFRRTEGGIPVSVTRSAEAKYTMETSRELGKRRPNENYYYVTYPGMQPGYLFAAPEATFAYETMNRLREMEEMVRFDLSSVLPEARDAYWQLAEMVRDLPANESHSVRLNFDNFRTFTKQLRELKDAPRIDNKLKVGGIADFIRRVAIAAEKVDQLEKEANSGNSEANVKLQGIRNNALAFLQYLREVLGLDVSDLTQMSVAKIFVADQKSELLNHHWESVMVPEIQRRVGFYNDDPKEYEEQRLSFLSLLTTAMIVDVNRDNL